MDKSIHASTPENEFIESFLLPAKQQFALQQTKQLPTLDFSLKNVRAEPVELKWLILRVHNKPFGQLGARTLQVINMMSCSFKA